MVRTLCWLAVVPAWITATGVSGLRPASRSRAAISARVAMPISTTSVPPARARASQSTDPGSPGTPTCPVTTVTDEAMPRWVTGTPADAGAAKAEETPGTTSQGTPAPRSICASSPPRPKTKGSPPLSRTTTAWRRACSRITALTSSWRRGSPGLLPTSMRNAEGGAMSSRLGSTRRS